MVVVVVVLVYIGTALELDAGICQSKNPSAQVNKNGARLF